MWERREKSFLGKAEFVGFEGKKGKELPRGNICPRGTFLIIEMPKLAEAAERIDLVII